MDFTNLREGILISRFQTHSHVLLTGLIIALLKLREVKSLAQVISQ